MATPARAPAYTIDWHKMPMKRTVKFPCDGCRTQLTCPIEDAGTMQRCPDCGVSMEVPGTAELAKARVEEDARTLAARKQELQELEASKREAAHASAAVVAREHNRERNARHTPRTADLGWVGLIFVAIGVALLIVGIMRGDPAIAAGSGLVVPGLIFLGIARLGSEVNRWGNEIADAIRDAKR